MKSRQDKDVALVPNEDVSTLRVGAHGKLVISNHKNVDLTSTDNDYQNTQTLIVRVGVTALSGKHIKAFGRKHERVRLTNEYAEYYISSSPIISANDLEIEIPVAPAREGTFSVELFKSTNIRGLVSAVSPIATAGLLGSKLEFNVAPRGSCLYASP